MHHRLEPKEHQFTYRIFMFALDLDEIDSVGTKVLGFARNRRSLYEFRDRDHLTLPELGNTGSVKQHVTTWIANNGIRLPDNGRIMLVTLPRVLGYIFNPVSFYFCADASGVPICAVVQVGNTYREMKPYLVGDRRFLLSALTGRRVPLTSARLAWLTLKYPLITLKVIFLIHWHAMLLWIKRLPWHRKAANAQQQRDIFNPHASIAPDRT